MPTAAGRMHKIAEMKVKRKGKVMKARCSPQEENRSGIDDFSDDK
jgi:hypothetical protein